MPRRKTKSGSKSIADRHYVGCRMIVVKMKSELKASSFQMRISIVVPSRNRAGKLRNTLEATPRLNRPSATHELVVVNSGSTDDTAQVRKEMAPLFGGHRVIWQPLSRAGPPCAGELEAAQCDILGFLKDDVLREKEWLTIVHDKLSTDSTLGGICRRVKLLNWAHLPLSVRTSKEPSELPPWAMRFHPLVSVRRSSWMTKSSWVAFLRFSGRHASVSRILGRGFDHRTKVDTSSISLAKCTFQLERFSVLQYHRFLYFTVCGSTSGRFSLRSVGPSWILDGLPRPFGSRSSRRGHALRIKLSRPRRPQRG